MTVFDANPASPTFHQVIGNATVSTQQANDVAVNPATNKIYVADNAGLRVINGQNLAVGTVTGFGSAASSVAVNPTMKMAYASNGFNLVFAVDGATDARIAFVGLPTTGGPSATGEGRLVIDNATGRVDYRYDDGPKSSSLAVIDGDPTHGGVGGTFNTVLTQIPAGWETAQSFMALDQSAGLLAVHTVATHTTTIIDAATSNPVGAVAGPLGSARAIAIDATTHRAYVTLLVGAIQTIDLPTATAQLTHVGTEVRTPVVDPTSHVAYVARTGLDTGVAVINSTGVVRRSHRSMGRASSGSWSGTALRTGSMPSMSTATQPARRTRCRVLSP